MGYTTSTVHGIEVPDSSEANDVPEDIGKVVTALEGGSIVKRLTSAAIAALTAPEKPAGLVVYNTTTGKVQVSNGTSFADVANTATYAIGVRSSTINVTHNSWWTVTHTSEDDPSSILASGVITLPTAGLWLIHGAARMSLVTDDGFWISLELNSAAINGEDYRQVRASTNSFTHEQSALVNASASDTIRLRIKHYNAGSGSRDCVGARLSAVKIG